MCEQNYENNKIGDYKLFVFFLQMLKSKFRLSVNREILNLWRFGLLNPENVVWFQ